MYRIERETPYSNDYTTVAYGDAKTEAETDARPPLKDPLSSEKVSEYGTVILAYPIWWHTAPMVVGTFLEAYEWNGADIYPITQSASMDAGQFTQSFEFVEACAMNPYPRCAVLPPKGEAIKRSNKASHILYRRVLLPP